MPRENVGIHPDTSNQQLFSLMIDAWMRETGDVIEPWRRSCSSYMQAHGGERTKLVDELHAPWGLVIASFESIERIFNECALPTIFLSPGIHKVPRGVDGSSIDMKRRAAARLSEMREAYGHQVLPMIFVNPTYKEDFSKGLVFVEYIGRSPDLLRLYWNKARYARLDSLAKTWETTYLLSTGMMIG